MKHLLIGCFLIASHFCYPQSNTFCDQGFIHEIICKRPTTQLEEKTTIDSAQLEILYHYEMLGDCLKPPINDEMILLIGKDYTNYYSLMNYTTDSLFYTDPQKYHRKTTTQILGEETLYFPDHIVILQYNIFNRGRYLINRASRELICVDTDIHQNRKSSPYDYCYEEILDTPLWNIFTDTDTVIGYLCQKGTTHYGGRDWIVWFAPGIPVSEGPWKLRGLPGLILKAETLDGEFSLRATALNYSTNRPIERYVENSCESVSKYELFRIQKEIAKDPYPNMFYGVPGTKEIKKYTADYNFIEIFNNN